MKVRFLSVIKVVELLFPAIGVCICVFLSLSFVSGRKVHLKMSSLEKWPAVRVVNGVVWPDFHHFFFDF